MNPDVLEWCDLCDQPFNAEWTCACGSENGRFDPVVSSPFGDPQDEWGER